MYRYKIHGDFVWRCCGHPDCAYQEAESKTTLGSANKEPLHYLCPHCKSGELRKRQGKKGPFWGCDKYPACAYTLNDYKGEPSTIRIYDYDD